MKKPMRSRSQRDVQAFVDAANDQAARLEGPAKKKWTDKDMCHLVPKTDNQKSAIAAWKAGCTALALLGSAGTGKTYLALQMAFRDALQRKLKVACVRSTVQSREQGFLPGDMGEKEDPFKEVFRGVLEEIFGRASTYDDMQAAKLLSFHSTSFLRGKTFNDTIMVVDECQNMTFEELNTVITRVGENSRIILMGDTRQNDVGKYSGLQKAMTLFKHMPANSMSLVTFTPDDIVRSEFTRNWLTVVENHA